MTERKAGRELDALVAEKVMGWVVAKDDNGRRFVTAELQTITSPNYLWSRAGEWYRIIGDPKELFPRASLLPQYSTDIAAAWRVVEKMIERQQAAVYKPDSFRWDGPIFKDKSQYLTNEGYPLGTECWFVKIEWGGHRKTVCAETAPLAICLAAIAEMRPS